MNNPIDIQSISLTSYPESTCIYADFIYADFIIPVVPQASDVGLKLYCTGYFITAKMYVSWN